MAMLRINTNVVPVADGTLRITQRETEAYQSRQAGTRLAPDRISMRRTFDFSTPPLTPGAATNIRNWVHSSGSPGLSVDGDAVEGVLSCFGVVRRSETVAVTIAGVFYVDARVLTITLDER